MSLEAGPTFVGEKPILLFGSQVIATVVGLIAIQYQKRYNKLHRSIYGLSYDTQWFQFLAHLLMVYCALNWRWNPIVKQQLQKRYPLFYGNEIEFGDGSEHNVDVPISYVMIVLDFLLCCNMWTLIRQLKKYGYTRHIHQGISTLASMIMIVLVFIFGIMSLWFAYWFGVHQGKDSGLLGIFWLDHVNYLWLTAQIFHVWAFWPQICINWMGQCCQGLSSRFVILYLFGSIIKFVGVYLSSFIQGNEIPFYLWPFNLQGKFVITMEFISIIIILLQAQYFYPSNKPHLQRQSEQKLSFYNTYSIA